MNDSVKILVIGLVCAVVCMILKQIGKEFIVPARLAAMLLIFGLIVGLIYPISAYIKNTMIDKVGVEYLEILLKSLGIAYVAHISSEMCRDFGEGNIASAIDIVGKIEIILLSLPLVEDITSISEELLKW